jgi:hypothetical protein
VFRLIFQPDPTMAKGKGHQELSCSNLKHTSSLFLIFLLLAFGGIIVYHSPLLISCDISAYLHEKLTVTDNEPDNA